MTLVIGACTFDPSSGGSGTPGTPATSTDGEGSTGTSGGSAPPADETADGSGSTDGGAVGHAEVSISDGPTFDFGAHDLTDTLEHAFTVTNAGDGDATALQVVGVDGAFTLVSHDCGMALAAGASCEVRVSFEPKLFGDHGSALQLAFQDAGVGTSASRPIVGRGVGTTDNLLMNGGGEEGDPLDIPPVSWEAASGPTWSTNWNPVEVGTVEGSRVISAGWGPPDLTVFTLFQLVSGESLTNWDDAAGVRFSYRASHRPESADDDPTWVQLRFLDASGLELEAHVSDTNAAAAWLESEGSFVAPAGTRRVQIMLGCQRMVVDSCNGFFDGIELWAEWPG
jgi:hypothetical protein